MAGYAGTAGKAFTKFSVGAAKGIGTAFVGASAVAGSAVLSIGTAAIKAYGEYEQLIGGVETLFGDSSKTVVEYANNAYKTAGLSANQYMSTVTGFSASLLQSLGGDTKKAASYADMAVTDMADNANKMGTSMESITETYQGFAKQNYTMLDNLKLGYGGTKKEMSRLLADASAISGIEYDISSYADVVDAIHVIQTEMGITGTTAKESSSTIQGSISAMSAAWQNVLAGMTDESQDFDKLLENLFDSVVTVGENLVPRIGVVLAGVTKLITTLAPQIIALIPTLVSDIFSAVSESTDSTASTEIGNILSQLVTLLLSYIPQMIEAGTNVFTGFISGFLSDKDALVSNIEAVFYAIVDAVNQTLPLLGNLATTIAPLIVQAVLLGLPLIWQLGLTILTGLVTGIANNFPMLLQTAVTMLTELGNALIANAPIILNAIATMIPVLLTSIPALIEAILAFLVEFEPVLLEAGMGILMALVNGLLEAIPMLVEMLPTIIETITTFLTEFLPTMLELGAEVLMALINGVVEMIPELSAMLPEIIETIVTFITDNLPEIYEMGMDVLVSLIEGIAGQLPQLSGEIVSLMLTILSLIVQNLPAILQAGGQILMSLIGGLLKMIPSLIGAIPQIISAITSKLSSFNWLSIGRNIVSGILNGFLNVGSIIYNTVTRFGNSVLGSIKSFFGIASPAKRMKPFGKFIGEGVAVGIDDSTEEVTDTVEAQGKAIQAEYKKSLGVAFSGGLTVPTVNGTKAFSDVKTTANTITNNTYSSEVRDVVLQGNINMDGTKVGEIVTPAVNKNLATTESMNAMGVF